MKWDWPGTFDYVEPIRVFPLSCSITEPAPPDVLSRVIEKPKIYFRHGVWFCRWRKWIGVGQTPVQAFFSPWAKLKT
jgi:hypothetical protein